MALKDWSLTPGDNDSVTDATYGNIAWGEGQNPNTVNDSSRAEMAHVRAFYETLEWRDWGHTPVYSSATVFTVSSASDLSSVYTVGRRIKATDSSTLYGVITVSSYAAATQTVTVRLDSGSLSASLTNISLGLDVTNASSAPSIYGTVDSVSTQTESAFTSIPAWVTEIEISMSGITTNGTNVPGIQIGDSGGYENTGYTGAVSTILAASTGVSNLSSAFDLTSSWSAATVVSGSYILTLIDPSANLWALRGGVGSVNTAAVSVTFGTKALTGTLDRVRVVMDGVDVFDGSGKININYKR
jgi:hypothetical protein